ncbi:hypothetical protein ENBRE01_0693 [Enteropsectra breve]|nr:hypothetical protein ENBRE01_0693 [Enteropsectra breve]
MLQIKEMLDYFSKEECGEGQDIIFNSQEDWKVSKEAKAEIAIEKHGQWPENFLPNTEYTTNINNKKLNKIEIIRMYKNSKIKSKRLAKIFTTLDLLFIREINAKDLIEYDGAVISKNVKYALNKNRGILNWLAVSDFSWHNLKTIMKEALILKNYNLVNIACMAAQAKQLNNRRIEKIVFYKKFLKAQESGIFPLEWLLKDCADCNLNKESEVATKRFCIIVEKLKEMKMLELPADISEWERQFIYGRCYDYYDANILLSLHCIEKKRAEKLYLVI